nr:spore coat protein U domain-containing protein [Pseudomonas parafulva]
MLPYQLAVDPSGYSRYDVGQPRAFTIGTTRQVPIPIYGVLVAQPMHCRPGCLPVSIPIRWRSN